eukprot:s291_g5.t1
MRTEFSVSFSVLGNEGSEISFLKRRLVKLKDGIMVVPGTTVEKVLVCFEKFFGSVRCKRLLVMRESNMKTLHLNLGQVIADSRAYRSIIGLLLYLSRDRIDVMFTVKELATSMSKPTLCCLQRLRRLVGYLKYTGNKSHRKSTSCAVHFLNGCFTYAYSRTQRVISLSSAESELHSMVSGCCDGLFIKRCAEFLLSVHVEHFQWTDNSAARQLVARQGVGKIRHLSGKILWIQKLILFGEVCMGQVPTLLNYSDVGTKVLTKSRLFFLLHEVGMMDLQTLEMIGQEEHVVTEQILNKDALAKVVRLVKCMSLVLGVQGLESLAADGVDPDTCQVSGTSHDSSELF